MASTLPSIEIGHAEPTSKPHPTGLPSNLAASHTTSPRRTASPTSLPQSSADPALAITAHAALKASPLGGNTTSKYSPRLQPLTGAAALADERHWREEMALEAARQTSPNPAASALSALLGVSNTGRSKARDALAAAKTMSEPMSIVAKSITIPTSNNVDNAQSSPISLSSCDSVEAMTAAATVTANGTIAAGSLRTLNQSAAEEESSNRPIALTYPGPLPPEHHPQGPSRGMSLPSAGYGRESPRSSPNAKKHKCPYCATDFTRHHNLKSHLLTHSHEKPYVCQTCNARFRRLHDLKRHTKLHTGERPHVCDKCGRRFARGDALARHNKGQGGCAGRRGSVGEEDYDGRGEPGDDSMEGVIYAEPGEDTPDAEDQQVDERTQRLSEPSRKRHKGSVDSRTERMTSPYRQHSSTYPPIGPNHPVSKAGGGGLQPPSNRYGDLRASTSPRNFANNPSPVAPGSTLSSINFTPGPPSLYAQGMMTESPKPLSPGQIDAQRHGAAEGSNAPRRRSPSLTRQFQQQQFARGLGRSTPLMGNLALPGHSPNGHHLPPMGSLGRPPSDPRQVVVANMQQSSNKGSSLPPPPPPPGPPPTTSMLSHQSYTIHGTASNPGSMSSHGHGSGGSMRELLSVGGGDIWAYVRNLESMFHRFQDDVKGQEREYENRIARLQDEVASLKGQLAAQGR